MKFSDWLTEYNKNAERVKDCITPGSEMLSLDGKTILFTIGKGAGVEIDGSHYEPKLLRSSYTNNKAAFDSVLANLQEKAQVMESAMAGYLEALTDHLVPEAVFRRIKGDTNVQGDSKSLLTEAAKNQWEKLFKNVRARCTFFGMDVFSCHVPIAEERFYFRWDGSNLALQWNGMTISGSPGHPVNLGHGGQAEVPVLLSFIQNYPKIEAAAVKIAERVTAVCGELAQDWDK